MISLTMVTGAFVLEKSGHGERAPCSVLNSPLMGGTSWVLKMEREPVSVGLHMRKRSIENG
jgi:hypothetical protein